MDRISRAIMFAVKAHDGQLDKKGLPVIFHPLTVMLKGKTESEQIVGVLHDVEEDTKYSMADINWVIGLTEEEISALRVLKHEKHEPYRDYIQRIKDKGGLAVRVKLNDLVHNSSEERLNGLPEETVARLKKKYSMAIEMLTK